MYILLAGIHLTGCHSSLNDFSSPALTTLQFTVILIQLHAHRSTACTFTPCPAKTFHLTYVTDTFKFVSELTLDFLWLRLSEESLNVMEGLWDLPDVFGEMSWWGLLPSQLQLLSLWRTPRGILKGERWVGKDRLCNSCAGELEKSNNEKMSDPLKVSTDNKDRGNEERKDLSVLTWMHR